MPTLLTTRRLAGIVFLAFALSAFGETIRLNSPSILPAKSQPNLLVNPSFEGKSEKGIPPDWIWDHRNTDATCNLDGANAQSGQRAIRIANGTAFGAHIYGMLRAAQSVQLQPGKAYVLSVYTRSEDPGIAWVGGGSNWQYRLRLPATQGRWQRAWMAFTPSEADRDFTLMLCTECPTKRFWVDDLKLEEGESPTLDASPTGKPMLEPMSWEKDVAGDGTFELLFNLVLPKRIADAQLQAELDRPAGQAESKLTIEAGAWCVRVTGEATAGDDSPHRLTLRLLDGSNALATVQIPVRFFSTGNGQARLAALAPKLAALARSLDAAKATKQDLAYPRVSLTVLENFAGYAREDLQHQEVRRALQQIAELESMAARLQQEIAEAAAGKQRFLEVPRWTGTQRPRVEGSSFLAPVAYPSRPGAPVMRPVFFYGYGHFGQAQADIEKFPEYGTNIIQCEIGPSSIFPAEGKTSDESVRHVQTLLDRGAKSGVAVCLLISPHYFPDWVLAKYPHLHKKREGFLQYCLHAPEGRELLRKYVAEIIRPIKDHPALHSICLSNEPVNAEEPCEYARSEFHAWLLKRHGTMAVLNADWGTQMAQIEDAPLPDPFKPDGVSPACWYDFVRFNQEFFAAWHRMLADAIHDVAPELPVHAKGMTWTMIGSSEVRFGVDAELFGGFSEINGNDSVCFYSHDPGEFAQEWQGNAAAYDLQRSVKDAPVFNTENHVIVDRETQTIPPEHVRAALWQQAIHGQSATTIWVWERTSDPRSDIAGSIMHRPACAEAAGRTALDLNRLAEEVTAIQRLTPQVAILHSVSGLVWDGGSYTDCTAKLYTALSLAGLKIGFVTERQLEAGQPLSVPLLFVPNLNHLSNAAFKALRQFRGRLVLIGDGSVLSHDEYNHERKERLTAGRLSFQYGKTTWQMLRQALVPKLAEAGVQPLVEVCDEQGRPAAGVSWLCAQSPQGVIVNLCNYSREPVRIQLRRSGRSIGGQDLLYDEAINGTASLSPLQTRLIRVPAQ